MEELPQISQQVTEVSLECGGLTPLWIWHGLPSRSKAVSSHRTPKCRPHLQGVVGALMIFAAIAASGCAHMDSFISDGFGPEEPVCRVAVNWTNQVVFTPDPTRNGTPIPGLAGRLYLFGEEAKLPLQGQGSLVVYVFDPARSDGQSPTIPIEGWRIDKDTLHRLERKDFVGIGYTLFLPWSTYRPDLDKIEVRVCFEPVKGSPIYAQPTSVTLNSGMSAPTVTTNHKVLAVPQPGVPTYLDPATNPAGTTTKTQDSATIMLGPTPGAAPVGGGKTPSGQTIVLDPEPGARLPGAAQ